MAKAQTPVKRGHVTTLPATAPPVPIASANPEGTVKQEGTVRSAHQVVLKVARKVTVLTDMEPSMAAMASVVVAVGSVVDSAISTRCETE